jgi:hypothetical protein
VVRGIAAIKISAVNICFNCLDIRSVENPIDPTMARIAAAEGVKSIVVIV